MNLEEMYNKFFESISSQSRTYVGASEIGYCIKKIIYDRLVGRVVPDSDSTRRLTLGTWFHEKFIKDLLPKLSEFSNSELILLATEETTDTSIDYKGIKGHYDFMYKKMSTGQIVVADLKTINSRALAYLKEEGIASKQHYYSQLQIYIAATKADLGELWFIDKDNFELYVTHVTPDSQHVETLVDKYALIQKHLVNKTLPDKPYTLPNENWLCDPKYCPSYLECWGLDSLNTAVSQTELSKVLPLMKEYNDCGAMEQQAKLRKKEIVYELLKNLSAEDKTIVTVGPKKKEKAVYTLDGGLTLEYSQTKEGLSLKIKGDVDTLLPKENGGDA